MRNNVGDGKSFFSRLKTQTAGLYTRLEYPVKITLIYTIAGAFWIALSDRALEFMVDDLSTISLMQTFKGWFYVLVTAILIYGLIKKQYNADRTQKESLAGSLREKELLLREIHHRVRNNLQIIISLLRMQFQDLAEADPQRGEALEIALSRIFAMALTHDLLYQSENFAFVSMANYTRSLISHHNMSNEVNRLKTLQPRPGNTKRVPVPVELHVEGDIQLPMDTALPCGMMINELLFLSSGAEHTIITLSETTDNGRSGNGKNLATGTSLIKLTITADKPVFTHQDTSLEQAIITTLIKQLEGEAEMGPATFSIIIPAANR